MHNKNTRRHTRRWLGTALTAATLGALATPMAWAQSPAANYPNRPVRLIVGFPAGTGPDIVARLLAQKMSEAWAKALE